MKKITLVISFIAIVFCTDSIAQYPDTIKINTTREIGYGPFPQSLVSMYPIDESDSLYIRVPKIKGVPYELKNLMYTTAAADYYQDYYQLYHSGKMRKKDFDTYKNQRDWNPTAEEYTREYVKLRITVAAGYDSANTLKIKVDKNNNYDLSDEVYLTIPEKLSGQNYWGRYNDSLPFEVEYEYYDGNEILKAKAWFFIDYSPRSYKSDQIKMNPIVLNYTFCQHNRGEFIINGKKYFIATKSDRPVYRPNYNLKMWVEGEKDKVSNFDSGIQKGGFVKIGNFYYRLENISLDGSLVTLVKDSSVVARGGSDVGQKAINFKTTTINGNEIELAKLRGKVVVLDFWGSWCAPCREELPTYKSIYEKYKDKDFVMIGIANDHLMNLKECIEEYNIIWPQIIQMLDKSLIYDYGVHSYPTSFLIGKDGKIIEKGIPAKRIEYLLNELL